MTDQPTPPQDQNSSTDTAEQNQPQDQSAAQSSSATTQDIEKLQAELEQAQTKLEEMTRVTQQALADLQNFRRRSEEEKTAFIEFANAELVKSILPALTNIARALQHEPKDAEWAKGVEQTFKQLTDALEKHGLKQMTTVGQKFDPKLHEALLMAPGEKDTILEELEAGFLLGERVIKPARVKVGNGEM
jgi:molecular chaperone GrpE